MTMTRSEAERAERFTDDVNPSDREPARCGECLPCRSDMARLVECEGNPA